ncbi:MAG: transglutaminase domain-containing protein, partial [Muribaculaceae bacterium]|nr:transglutaminase domain-containing protein [Muribaculaceae bacterium]
MRFSHITHTLLLTVGTAAVLSPAFLPARTILTPQASADYTRRLTLQPELAGKLAIPSSASPEETEVLTFLYAYIPTPDVVDYDSVFYLENVRMALRAAEEMPWGKDVPDREWRHFVLPVRVNNEDLDLSRKVFYDELKQRVEGLSMKEAILEINHWCHEKVSYQPSDQRTSSPLVTVGNALGRCGEESTFTVAALRSVGIPARQVYTPRWAHTDDNHAWVEVWADGRWWFLGACEPEPVLNLAWFNAPAARGMMMTTKVPGVYDGPEEKLEERPISTVINVTENYAPTAQSTVYVMDADGRPVKGADVRFGLYNYAEFFPLTVKKTDADGKATVISGNGDL